MKQTVRDALDRLCLEVSTAGAFRDLALVEAELLSHEELLKGAREDLLEVKQLLQDAALEVARAQEFTA